MTTILRTMLLGNYDHPVEADVKNRGTLKGAVWGCGVCLGQVSGQSLSQQGF